MENDASRLCRFVKQSLRSLVALCVLSSCATAHVKNPENLDEPGKNLDVQTELSSNEVAAGNLVLVSITLPSDSKEPEQVEGKFEGKKFPFFPVSEKKSLAYQALLAIPYERDPGPGKIEVAVRGNSQEKSQEKIYSLPIQVLDGQYPSEKLSVDPRRVTPPQRDLQRILKEQAEVKAIYERVTPKKYWNGPFVLPINSKVTSPFGSRRVYNGSLKNYHPGLDLKAAIKTPIRSAAPGVVVLAKNLFYTGKTIMVDHGYGVITLYAHMSQLRVKKGQTVKQKELLGLSGMTGRVNGPHLHWQAVVHHVKVNPMGLVQVLR